MRSGFYSRIAWGNLKKNVRFYVPHILAGIGLQAAFYIILTLTLDNRLSQVRGGSYISAFMALGTGVMVVLSTILILYTNSFLMKQRKREFGLYNVLGMEKRHVGKVLFYESLISNSISVIVGLITGIIFYKLCSLIICLILHVDSVLGFYYIKAVTIIPSGLFFIALDVAAYIMNRIAISRMKPVELLRSNQTGEREPKVKWLLFIPGIATLTAGYVISLKTDNALEAITMFFPAVFLVIIGTYLLFVAGSIAILKLLKRNKGYYYNKKHMISVSGMLYRMKQNAVGLASITILATMILVMVSTTFSLYAGFSETIANRYPQQVYVKAFYLDDDGNTARIPDEALEAILLQAAEGQNYEISRFQVQDYLEVGYRYDHGRLSADQGVIDKLSADNVVNVYYLTLDVYNTLTGEGLELSENEIAVSAYKPGSQFAEQSLEIAGRSYQIKEKLTYFPLNSYMEEVVDCYGIVVADQSILDEIYEEQKNYYDKYASEYDHRLAISFKQEEISDEAGEAMGDAIYAGIKSYVLDHVSYEDPADVEYWVNLDTIWDTRTYVFGMYGTLLFLGLILGFVFIFATVLIIYYKQISEGYEDRDRYQIMQKIGMSPKEVKKSINSQIRIVFFLPLLVTALHLVMAFRILEQMLHILMLSSSLLFVECTLIAFAGFVIIYVVIFKMTARTYYKIVR